MNRPSKAMTQAKKVAPPAVPDVFRHSGSSFGSAGYASSEDSCFLPGSGPGGTTEDGSYGMPSGKSPGPIFTHPGFAFPPVVGKYAHAEDQGRMLYIAYTRQCYLFAYQNIVHLRFIFSTLLTNRKVRFTFLAIYYYFRISLKLDNIWNLWNLFTRVYSREMFQATVVRFRGKRRLVLLLWF